MKQANIRGYFAQKLHCSVDIQDNLNTLKNLEEASPYESTDVKPTEGELNQKGARRKY